MLVAKNRKRLQKSFYEFVKEAFEVIHPGQIINDNWHIEYICNVLQSEVERITAGLPKTKDLIINVPPRSLKSFVTTICFPAWTWTINPRLKFIGSSYSDTLAMEHNVLTRRIVESEWYQTLFDVKIERDQNTKSKFENTEQGFRSCTSTGGTVTGTGADVIIVDDPINPRQAASEVARKNANDHFNQTLSTRLNNPETGIFIIIMQRLHEDDLTGHELKNNPDAYFHICLDAEASDNVKPSHLLEKYNDGLFFPGRFTRQVLEKFKLALGSYGYAGQFRQKPAPDEGGLIKKAWFKTIGYTEFINLVGDTPINFFLDTAYTANQKNDPTALMPVCFFNNNLYILDSTTVWKDLPDLLKFIPDYVLQHKYTTKSRILIEPKASGLSTIQSFKNTSFNVLQLDPPKDDKETRASNASPFIESGRCILVEGSWNDSFLHEIAVFPNGEHDDQLDNLVNAVTYYQKNGVKGKIRISF